MTHPSFPWIAAGLFGLALIHTFCTQYFERLALRKPRHAGLWHLLGEIEVVFGFWALILALTMMVLMGKDATVHYVESLSFKEPLFVFAIMVIAATRPILQACRALAVAIARLLPFPASTNYYFVVLAFVPLMGSLITEPAAMTLAALLLKDAVFTSTMSDRFKYLTLGALFVNVSIGGSLTHFAAPPIVMVAHSWAWDGAFVFKTLGLKALGAVLITASWVTLVLRRELTHRETSTFTLSPEVSVPRTIILIHFIFLFAVISFAHHPVIFVALLLFFIGYTSAYAEHQDPLLLRQALLVGFFLAGLQVLGGQQAWWLQDLVMKLGDQSAYWGALILTPFIDNAAITYLASLVPNLSTPFKIGLVAGALSGGGLTIIANAPNPAGLAILKEYFSEGLHSGKLLRAAAIPTMIAALAFSIL